MSRTTDTISAVYFGRHCHHINCRKCRARARWNRRRAWRSRKKPDRRSHGRKR